jgi:hypothetical protein
MNAVDYLTDYGRTKRNATLPGKNPDGINEGRKRKKVDRTRVIEKPIEVIWPDCGKSDWYTEAEFIRFHKNVFQDAKLFINGVDVTDKSMEDICILLNGLKVIKKSKRQTSIKN